ncbi:hypothetical protein DAKH74_040540 [Maudiozyma humilis]|uniref:C2H2-type domain-containing protein n=1 Tax=Maudiozyma humilis TaxID=51915 RepID=A0AAV5S140_MAUHU|nr:hypothetical protein DAKH74_040540 [Kazachstania humilis]
MPYPYPMMEDSDPRRNVSNTSNAYAQQPYATAATTYAYAYPYEYKYAGNPNSAGNPGSTGNPNSAGSSNGLSSSVTLLGDSATPSLYQDSLVHPLKFDSYADVYGRTADFAAMPQPTDNATAGPGPNTAAEWWRPPSQGAYGVAMQMQMPLSVAQYGLPAQQQQPQQQPQQYTQYAMAQQPQYSMVPVGMGLVYPEATAGTGPGAARNYVATSMGGGAALLPAKAMSPPAADEPRSSVRAGGARGGVRGKSRRKGNDAVEATAAAAVGTAGADAADALTTYDEAQKFKYGCKLCGKRFKRPSSLKTHTNIHTGFRPFVCPYKQCEKAFNAKSNMLRHYKLHFKLRSGAYILPNGQISMEKPTSKQLFGTKQ